ncbi:MAG: transporter substrate-binding domain-containing protein [Betaproteobacteria bacterium]|nr:transporter substrate-binding domain-containing protein [Betaproteobacteria bacterium]
MAQWSVIASISHRFQRSGRALATLLAFALVCLSAAPAAADDEKTGLQKIQERGTIKVAFYKDFPPFSDNEDGKYSDPGKGLDVDLADALAAKLGVKVAPLWFDADEFMQKDFRWMLVSGHPLGFGPADLMMHVPVDSDFMARVKQVAIFAPYHRERFAIGRLLEKLPTLESLEPFETLPIATEDGTMGQQVMVSADNRRYINNVKLFRYAHEAIAALKSGTVPAAIAQEGELEGALSNDPRYAIEQAPNPLLKMRQWPIGIAVKAENTDLAKALQKAMNELVEDGTVEKIKQRHGVKNRKP